MSDSQAPEGTVCGNTRCGRSRSLWLREDTGTWFCWPHYKMQQNRIPQYNGRKQHHDFAVEASRSLHQLYMNRFDGGVDYAADQHYEHRSFAVTALGQIGKPVEDKHLQWLKSRTWAEQALQEDE